MTFYSELDNPFIYLPKDVAHSVRKKHGVRVAYSVLGVNCGLLSGEGQVARAHFDDEGECGAFALLLVDVSALTPA